MQTILIAIGLVTLTMLALGVGVACGRPPLQRTCGGKACLGTCRGCDRLGRSDAP